MFLMLAFVATVLVSVFSGLFWLAFNHPKGYQRLFPFLAVFGFVVFVGLAGWNSALQQVLFIGDISSEAMVRVRSLEIIGFPNLMYLFLAYHIILSALGFIHEFKDDKE